MQDYTATAPPRPTSVTVVAVIAIVLGSLSTCCGLYTGFSLVMSERLQAVSEQIARSGQSNEAVLREQRAMQDEMQAFQRGWAPFTGTFVVLQLLVGLVSVAGGALALKGTRIARPMLMGTFAFGALAQLVRSAGETYMQFQIMAVMQGYMSRVMAASQRGVPMPAGFNETMGAMTGVASVAGIVITLVWVVAKLAYYAAGTWALRREDARRYFS